MPSTAASWLSNYPRRPGELQNAFIDASRLYDTAVLCEIAVKHRKPAILRKGMFEIADRAALAIDIRLLEAPLLAEGDGGRHATRRRAIKLPHRLALCPPDIPAPQGIAQCRAVNRPDL